ncbi:MAG: D-glycero-beta-D-manno-heptose 1-phosphate adenylyltransferase [Gemmatimonadetes bacterium]|nr:D-glycero-beta-D-manno-heptose 1-phosphate adenylyltransferase [Gemmatimonadota bacterium]
MTALAPPRQKLLSRAELLKRYGPPRRLRLVFTNGCFDLLHRGHVEYLYEARALGDALVVGLNSDTSARRLEKGEGRPFVPEEDRAAVLAGLACVDAVVIFQEDSPRALIAELLPDVLVKGGDYRADEVVGREEVEAVGGCVVILHYRQGQSTSGLIQRIRQGR